MTWLDELVEAALADSHRALCLPPLLMLIAALLRSDEHARGVVCCNPNTPDSSVLANGLAFYKLVDWLLADGRVLTAAVEVLLGSAHHHESEQGVVLAALAMLSPVLTATADETRQATLEHHRPSMGAPLMLAVLGFPDPETPEGGTERWGTAVATAAVRLLLRPHTHSGAWIEAGLHFAGALAQASRVSTVQGRALLNALAEAGLVSAVVAVAEALCELRSHRTRPVLVRSCAKILIQLHTAFVGRPSEAPTEATTNTTPAHADAPRSPAQSPAAGASPAPSPAVPSPAGGGSDRPAEVPEDLVRALTRVIGTGNPTPQPDAPSTTPSPRALSRP